ASTLFVKIGWTCTIASKRKSKSHYFIRVNHPRTLFSLFYPLFLLNRAVLGWDLTQNDANQDVM
ncbi:hypothetical protein, partial [Nostoc sp. UCD120]|uniref:hypothetical protein n=1 Tax=Nostoc sp. UCD120 TaxID=2681312 RepID=UPI001C8AC183